MKNIFKQKPSQKLLDRLSQSRLLISRLNEDQDIQIPKVYSLLKKYFKDFDDELFSTFESFLLICKKVAEYKDCGFYEFEPWFEIKMESCVRQVFSISNLLEHEDNLRIEEFIFQFYSA